LTDIDFQMMTAEERGVYCSLIFYLYCNNGKLDLNHNTDITLLQNMTSKLAVISGCQRSGSEWHDLWAKIEHKFKIIDNTLTHKRVTEELEKAESYRKNKSDAGKKGMKNRWPDNTVMANDNTVITTKTKAKVSKENSLELNKLAMEYDRKITAVFGELLPREKTTFRNIRLFLRALGLDQFRTAVEWIGTVKQWGDDTGKDNIEVKKCYVSKIKKLGWKP